MIITQVGMMLDTQTGELTGSMIVEPAPGFDALAIKIPQEVVIQLNEIVAALGKYTEGADLDERPKEAEATSAPFPHAVIFPEDEETGDGADTGAAEEWNPPRV